ncbi:hypothetical protein GCM10007989_21340 [Devosia pacifica]|uniref:Uncharacterized protein n=1 Tax=Devosia pacifica TaxID=1335967 RepID=A0A918S5I9_9HYPH|nr:hypothetical protein [Devosia pacifica]GHA25404.1 hypothetical protein GCM10007989_21340 [Devosia pacifica]
MKDRFQFRTPSLEGPASDAFAITPDDAADLPEATRALYVGRTGDIALLTISGTSASFIGVPAGSILPIRASRVFATGTDAGDLVGLV